MADDRQTDVVRAVSRSRWVVEVHLTRAGLWNEPVGLAIRAAWARGDELDQHETTPAVTEEADRG